VEGRYDKILIAALRYGSLHGYVEMTFVGATRIPAIGYTRSTSPVFHALPAALIDDGAGLAHRCFR
jgi:hypothetical protein